MKHRVVVSPEADDDVQRLRDFMVEVSPATWPRAAEEIAKGIETLAEFPDRGRPMLRSGRREVFIPFGRGAYVIQYRVIDQVVFVARIFHSREDRPLA